MCITKEDFRSCMNEKRFQEVLEEVAYQRAFYREQRAQQMEEEQQQVCVRACACVHLCFEHFSMVKRRLKKAGKTFIPGRSQSFCAQSTLLGGGGSSRWRGGGY